MNDMKVQSARIGKDGKQGGGRWVWSLPESLDDQDALCGESENLNPEEPVKVLTENPQTTLTPDVEQGEHLNIPDSVDEDEVRI